MRKRNGQSDVDKAVLGAFYFQDERYQILSRVRVAKSCAAPTQTIKTYKHHVIDPCPSHGGCGHGKTVKAVGVVCCTGGDLDVITTFGSFII